MQIREHKSRNLPSLIGEFRLSRTWTMDEDMMTGKITNKELEKVLSRGEKRIVYTSVPPTCENLCCHFSKMVQDMLPSNINLHHIKLYETSTSYAEWYAEDNL